MKLDNIAKKCGADDANFVLQNPGHPYSQLLMAQHRRGAFRLPRGVLKFRGGKVWLPAVGWIKIADFSPVSPSEIVNAWISREADGKWCIQFEVAA